jgi:hypothetical protein
MKLSIICAAAFIAAAALGLALGPTVARADYNGGGPAHVGNHCFHYTDARGHGFWGACPKAMH